MLPILLVIFLLLAIGGLPMWPYATTWDVGYWPSGLFGLLFLIVLIWALVGGPWARRGPLV